jgi:hypothetical protein
MLRLYFLPALLFVVSTLLCLITYLAIFLSLATSLGIVLVMFIRPLVQRSNAFDSFLLR